MSQSKLPARCRDCGLVGPPRKRAEAEGWVRVSHGGSSRAEWLCPPHGTDYVKERTRILQGHRDQSRLRTLALLSAMGIVSR